MEYACIEWLIHSFLFQLFWWFSSRIEICESSTRNFNYFIPCEIQECANAYLYINWYSQHFRFVVAIYYIFFVLLLHFFSSLLCRTVDPYITLRFAVFRPSSFVNIKQFHNDLFSRWPMIRICVLCRFISLVLCECTRERARKRTTDNLCVCTRMEVSMVGCRRVYWQYCVITWIIAPPSVRSSHFSFFIFFFLLEMRKTIVLEALCMHHYYIKSKTDIYCWRVAVWFINIAFVRLDTFSN